MRWRDGGDTQGRLGRYADSLLRIHQAGRTMGPLLNALPAAVLEKGHGYRTLRLDFIDPPRIDVVDNLPYVCSCRGVSPRPALSSA